MGEDKLSIILVGNKIDLNRVVAKETAEEYAKTNGLTYYEISIKKRMSVDVIFEELTRQVLKNHPELLNQKKVSSRVGAKRASVSKKKEEESGGCC